MFDVWVRYNGEWEQYTKRPFATEQGARAWVSRYLPYGEIEVRAR